MENNIRENIINQGISFLKGTQSSSLSRRINFLEEKGLSNQEILESLKRSDVSWTPGNTGIINQPSSSIWAMASSAVAILGVGCLVYTLSGIVESDPLDENITSDENITLSGTSSGADGIMNSTEFQGNNSDEIKSNQSKGDLIIEELSRIGSTLEKHIDRLDTRFSEIKDVLEKEPSWVKELSKLTIVITELSDSIKHRRKHQEGSVSAADQEMVTASDIDSSSQMEKTPTTPVITLIQRKEKLLEAAIQLKNKNTEGSSAKIGNLLKVGCEALRMYLSNIADHPDVPRYRKITTSNQNFKTLVAPLEAHKEFFQGAGFTHRQTSNASTTGFFEWLGGAVAPTPPEPASESSVTLDKEEALLLLREGIRLLNVIISGGELIAVTEASFPDKKNQTQPSTASPLTVPANPAMSNSVSTSSASSNEAVVSKTMTLNFEEIQKRVSTRVGGKGDDIQSNLTVVCDETATGKVEDSSKELAATAEEDLALAEEEGAKGGGDV